MIRSACAVSIPRKGTHPATGKVAPDRLFALRNQHGMALMYALELDRGTVDIRRRYRAKLEAYYHAWRQARHREQWGCKNSFRVLTITTSDKRIERMIAAQRDVTDNDSVPGLFAYATPQRIREHGAHGPAWSTSKRNGLLLLDAR